MTLQNKLCTVKCTYHHFQNKNEFERFTFFFNDARYLTLGTFKCPDYTDVSYSDVTRFVLVGQHC